MQMISDAPFVASTRTRAAPSGGSRCVFTAPLRMAGPCIGMVLLGALAALPARAQDRDPMLVHARDGLSVRGHLQFGLNAVAERNLFWDLAETTNPGSGFDADTDWLEAYIKPGLSFEYQLEADTVL